MQSAEYSRMLQAEDVHWWYAVLRHQALNALISRFGETPQVLDAGCGTGGMLHAIYRKRPAWTLHGIDIEPVAVASCHGRGLVNVSLGDVSHLSFDDESFDAVLSLDVLYHASVHEEIATREMTRVLRKGGVLVVNLPAFDALRGSHDVAVCGVRRYRACHVRSMLERHRLQVEMIHYWNAWLFVPLIFRRHLSRRADSDARRPLSDLAMHSRLLNKVLKLAGIVDASICRVFRVPFGSSVFAVATKPRVEND